MKRILAAILVLTVLMMGMNISLAEEPSIKITDAEGKEIYSGPFDSNIFSTYSNGAQYEITGDVSDDIVFSINEAKLIVNGEVKARTAASGKDNSVAVVGNINSENDYGVVAENNGVWNENTGESSEKTTNVTVSVDGDVSAYWSGINAQGDSTVTTEGNVKAGHLETGTYPDGGTYSYYAGEGIYALDNATVTVAGNVESEGTGIGTRNSERYDSEKETWVTDTITKAEVNVGGNVTSNHGTGVSVEGESTVIIGGNVDAYSTGISSSDDATVVVGGNIKAGHEEKETNSDGGEYTWGSGDGVSAAGNSTILVAGNVESEGTAISTPTNWHEDEDGIWVEDANTSTIVVDGNVTSNRSDGISSVGNTTVTVGGNVKAYRDGIDASGEATVTVVGDVKAGHLETGTRPDEEEYSFYTGRGIYANGNTTITVLGNVESESTGINTWDSGHSDGNGNYVLDPNQVTISVGGDVTSNHENAIWVSGESTITVGGDVEGAEGGIYAFDNSSWEYNKDKDKFEEVTHANKSQVVVEGNVTAKENEAIGMDPNATIKVWGNVTGGEFAEEEEEGPGGNGDDYEPTEEEIAYEEARDEAAMKAWDELFGEYAERFNDEGNNGAIMINSGKEANGELIVGGTVTANGESVPIVISLGLDVKDGTEIPDLAKVLPEMKVYEIAPNDGEYFQVDAYLYANDVEIEFEANGEEYKDTVNMSTGYLSGEERAELVETLAKTLQYIIKVINPENGQIDLSGVTYDSENDLMLAHENDEIAVRVSAKNGYRVTGVDAGDIAELIDNKDGTWTVIVKRGGGVTISARLAKVPAKVHPAVGKTFIYGHYDKDGDGTAEELSWLCTKVSGRYAQLALIDGFDKLPEDFSTAAFSAEELEGIKDGAVSEMGEKEVAKRFKDEKVHPMISVKLDKLGF